jgi:anti-sigma B factor antagonist
MTTDDFRVSDYALDSKTHIIEVEGQVDLYTAPEFKQRTLDVIRDGKKRVIVDLSGVGFMDSTGLGVLVGALKRLRKTQGELMLVVTDYDVERLLQITGLDGVFSIYRSRDDALEQLTLAHDA